MSNTTI